MVGTDKRIILRMRLCKAIVFDVMGVEVRQVEAGQLKLTGLVTEN